MEESWRAQRRSALSTLLPRPRKERGSGRLHGVGHFQLKQQVRPRCADGKGCETEDGACSKHDECRPREIS